MSVWGKEKRTEIERQMEATFRTSYGREKMQIKKRRNMYQERTQEKEGS